MYNTISHKLNYIPYQTSDVKFQNWVKTYKYHIDNLYNIFCGAICDVEPFKNMNMETPDYFEKFAYMLYKKSSRII
jgi:hypothetical protein